MKAAKAKTPTALVPRPLSVAEQREHRFEHLTETLREHEMIARMFAGTFRVAEEIAALLGEQHTHLLTELWPGLNLVATRMEEEGATVREELKDLFSAGLDAEDRAHVADIAESIRRAPKPTRA